MYGTERTLDALGRYARRYRFQHPGPNELFTTMGEVLGRDAEELLRSAIEQQGTVDYEVSDFWSWPSPSATDGGKGYDGSVLVRRHGALVLPVDVDLYAKDGSVQRIVWEAREPVARLGYSGKSPMVAAVIDPGTKGAVR